MDGRDTSSLYTDFNSEHLYSLHFCGPKLSHQHFRLSFDRDLTKEEEG
jgi:hypothetical protein